MRPAKDMETPQPQVQQPVVQEEKKEQLKQEAHPNLNKGGPGRNTKYQPEFVLKVNEYITKVHNGEMPHEYFPTKEGFALFIGINSPETITRWANKRYKKDDLKIDPKLRGKLVYPDFYGAITRLVNIQKMQIMNDGMYLGKKVNDRMARFILTVNHSMVETTNTDLTTKGKELPIPLLEGISNVPKDNSAH